MSYVVFFKISNNAYIFFTIYNNAYTLQLSYDFVDSTKIENESFSGLKPGNIVFTQVYVSDSSFVLLQILIVHCRVAS